MGFRPGHIYPLLEADRYDDENGAGFDHVYFAPDSDVREEYFVADAWIVNAEGRIHPGYDECPVPVRPEDVDLAAGKAMEFEMPAPNWAPGWS